MLAAKLGLLVSALLLPEDVDLRAGDGVKIAAVYSKPAVAGKRPALILVHQLGGKKEEWGEFPAEALKAGYAVLAIDMRGHGKSDHPYAKDRERRNIERWGKEEWQEALKDLKAAKEFLTGKAEVDARKIVFVGSSIGGNLSLAFAASDAAVKAVALLSPGENYRGISAAEAIEAYGERPVFCAASEDDPYSAQSARRLLAKTKHKIKNLRVYKNAGHGTKMFGNEDEIGDLTAELLRWLAAATR